MRRPLNSVLLLGLGLSVHACGGGVDDDTAAGRKPAALAATPLPIEDGAPPPRVIHESLRVQHPNGSSEVVVEGGLDFETYQRLDRPQQYGHEAELIGEEAWEQVLEDGTVLRGYRVVAAPNAHPVVPEPQHPEVRLGEKLTAALAAGALEEVETLALVLRDAPDWTVPSVPPAEFLSTEDALAAHQARDAAIEQRKRSFAERSAPVRRVVEKLGGTTSPHGWVGGVVTATLPSAELEQLFELPELLTIERSDAVWRDAQLVLGQMGEQAFVGWDEFHVDGYDGETSNPNRHAFGDLTVAILEGAALEDEACFLDDSGCNDTGRLAGRYDCSNPDGVGDLCDAVSNFADTDSAGADHATRVTSIALGQYSEGQDGGANLIVPSDPAWIEKAEGPAPESKVVFMASTSLLTTGRFEAAVEKAIELDVDAISLSQEADSNCSVIADEAHLEAVEDAYLSGIFFAACTGNNGADTDDCSISDPGAIPRAFTIGGTGASGCSSDYRLCKLAGWRMGGADATTWDNVARAQAISAVDAHAPGYLSYTTGAAGAQGTVTSSGFNGCSFATPLVAGSAMALKSQYLDQGDSWINSSGRLHTVMLMHTDRHRASTSTGTTAQATTGADRRWGLGRFKLTGLGLPGLTGVNGRSFATTSFTPSTGNYTHIPWSAPLPSGTHRVKCVLFQAEDMSDGKTKISDLDLRVYLREPGILNTCSSAETIHATRADTSYDTKSMVAFDTSTTTLAGRCVDVRVENDGVVSGTTLTAHVACHYAWRKDDEPN